MKQGTLPNPPTPDGDLRNQLLHWTIEKALSCLKAGAKNRATTFSSGIRESYSNEVRDAVVGGLGWNPAADFAVDLNSRKVSSYDLGDCTLENVLFDSLPGWEVNASVFVPKGKGPFIPVVIPVGHSGKQFANYQIPARAYASLGFLAVLFDPPGQASEKQPGNDHFADGVRSFPLGLSPNRYFVYDAVRCIDYVESRSDTDTTRGIGMTGVSGGGITTTYAGILDSRIACIGPSCCLNLMADHPIGDAYSACPESFWYGRLAQGVDNIDLVAASIPKPCLLMAGRDDEVFTIDASRRIADELRSLYRSTGMEERFGYFEDNSGHAYTLTQTARFSAWMRRWISQEPDPSIPGLDPDSFALLDYEMLRCRPAARENMYTVTEKMANAAAKGRQGTDGSAGAARKSLENLIGPVPPLENWRESDPFRVWTQDMSEGLFSVDGLEIPVSVFRPRKVSDGMPLVLYLDDNGRRGALESGGPAQSLTMMTDRDPASPHPTVFVPDLPGCGDSVPAVAPYAISPWGSMQRLLGYFLYGLGDGLIYLKTRAAVSLLRHLTAHDAEAGKNTVLVGRGIAGMVAILTAWLFGRVKTLILIDSLSSVGSLLGSESYTWPEETFLPGILRVADIPELLSLLVDSGTNVYSINPRDGQGEPYHGLPPRGVETVSGLSEQSAAEYTATIVNAMKSP